jgi:hypothetical protein
MNTLGQVTSFNYSFNNSLVTYRTIGSRFIQMPQIGMRRQTLSCNVIMSIPAASDGIPSANQTSILELIRNYLGYQSSTTVGGTYGGAPFTTTDILRPALATSTDGSGTQGSPQVTVPVEKFLIQLNVTGTNGYDGTSRGATVNVRNAAIEGFGLPVQLENGLIEIPITFSVRGYQYKRVSDGSYSGHDGTAGQAFANYNPILTWWF